MASRTEPSACTVEICVSTLVLCVLTTDSVAGNVTLAWDPVIHPDLRGYIVYYTNATATSSPPSNAVFAAYSHRVNIANTTTYTIPDLAEGARYRFAVTAYDSEQIESSYSSEVAATVPYGAIVADFAASTRTGAAPMAMNFISTSTGTVTTFAWAFGDGAGSSVPHPSHVYTQPGVYTVSLSVAGPNGSSTKTVEGCVIVSPLLPMIKPAPKVRSGEAPSEPASRNDLGAGS